MGPKRRNQFASKHVRLAAQQSFPEPEGDQFVVRLVKSRGGNTMECEDASGGTLLCWLPNKFSKVVWAQRGDYLIVAPSVEEGGAGGKITATIVHILFPEQVDHLRETSESWPTEFAAEAGQRGGAEGAGAEDREGEEGKEGGGGKEGGEGAVDEEQDSDDDADLFVNSNHDREDSFEDDEEASDEG